MPGVSSSAVDQLYVGVSAPARTATTIPYAINGARNSGAWTVAARITGTGERIKRY
jgi:hypothetical protein